MTRIPQTAAVFGAASRSVLISPSDSRHGKSTQHPDTTAKTEDANDAPDSGGGIMECFPDLTTSAISSPPPAEIG